MQAMHANAPQRSESARTTRGIEVADVCCTICGSKAIVFDEVDKVIDEVMALELGECLHCEHRWTVAGGSPVGLPAPEADLEDGTSDIDTCSWNSRVSNAA